MSPKGLLTSCHPVGRTPSCLPSSATKILAFCSPKPGKARTRRRRSVPLEAPSQHAGGVPAVFIHNDLAELLDTAGIGSREPVERRPLRENLCELGGIHRCDRSGVELATEAVPQVPGRAEGSLQGDLLVEDHAYQQREWVLGEQCVRLWVPLRDGASNSVRASLWPSPELVRPPSVRLTWLDWPEWPQDVAAPG